MLSAMHDTIVDEKDTKIRQFLDYDYELPSIPLTNSPKSLTDIF